MSVPSRSATKGPETPIIGRERAGKVFLLFKGDDVHSQGRACHVEELRATILSFLFLFYLGWKVRSNSPVLFRVVPFFPSSIRYISYAIWLSSLGHAVVMDAAVFIKLQGAYVLVRGKR